MEIVGLLGRGGLIGGLLGLGFVTWVNPGTIEGWLLLLSVCVGIGVVVSLLFGSCKKLLASRAKHREPKVDNVSQFTSSRNSHSSE